MMIAIHRRTRRPTTHRGIPQPPHSLERPARALLGLTAGLVLLLLALLGTHVGSALAAAVSGGEVSAPQDGAAAAFKDSLEARPAGRAWMEPLPAGRPAFGPPSPGPSGAESLQRAAAMAPDTQPATANETWVLQEVRFGGTECDTPFNRDDGFPIGGGAASLACSVTDSWGTASVNGTMSLSYPLVLTYDEPGTFAAQASGSFGWSLPRGGRARLVLEMDGDVFSHSPGCSEVENPESGLGGATDSAGLQASVTCSPDRNWWFGDEGWFEFKMDLWVFQGSGIGAIRRAFAFGKVWLHYEREIDPEAHVALQGHVTTVAEPGEEYPLIGVPVTALRNGVQLARGVTRHPDGLYTLPSIPVTDSVTLSVTLEHAAANPHTFRILSGTLGGPLVYVATRPFDVAKSPDPLTRDIRFADRPDIITDGQIDRRHLNDLGTMYAHFHQAWQLANRQRAPLDFQLPVDVVAFSRLAGNWGGVYWSSRTPAGAVDPFINIEALAGASAIGDGGRPDNREWHEFGHHVMADIMDDRMPWYNIAGPPVVRDINHRGCEQFTTRIAHL